MARELGSAPLEAIVLPAPSVHRAKGLGYHRFYLLQPADLPLPTVLLVLRDNQRRCCACVSCRRFSCQRFSCATASAARQPTGGAGSAGSTGEKANRWGMGDQACVSWVRRSNASQNPRHVCRDPGGRRMWVHIRGGMWTRESLDTTTTAAVGEEPNWRALPNTCREPIHGGYRITERHISASRRGTYPEGHISASRRGTA